jgi:predicted GTPase
MTRLRSLLEAVSAPGAAEMLQRARIDQREKPRMVLTGQYSSGKSSLIKALTDGTVEPVIDADIATDAVTEYPWDGAVVLVDTQP